MLDLLILGDSLAFPRPSDPVSAQDAAETWPAILLSRRQESRLWLRSAGQATSIQLLAQAKSLRGYLGADSVALTVIQCGIVDASPRPYPYALKPIMDGRTVTRVAARLPKHQHPSRNRHLLAMWGRPWINTAQFQSNIDQTMSILGTRSRQVALLEIQQPGPRTIELLGTYDVAPYNDALRAMADKHPNTHFVSCQAELTADGHHLSRRGHQQFADSIYEQVPDS